MLSQLLVPLIVGLMVGIAAAIVVFVDYAPAVRDDDCDSDELEHDHFGHG